MTISTFLISMLLGSAVFSDPEEKSVHAVFQVEGMDVRGGIL